MQALKACLEDSAVLVQRNTLDVLSTAFPFHSSPLTKQDQAAIIQSALLVLLRRDMSLNRRLYGWLLGVTTTGIVTRLDLLCSCCDVLSLLT